MFDKNIWIPMALLRRPDLSDGAKILWGRIAMFAGKDGRCFANRETLASECGWSLDCLKRNLAELVDAGLIRRIRSGPNRPAVCEFLWDDSLADSLKAGKTGDEPSGDSPSDGANIRHQDTRTDGANIRHQDGAEMRHQADMTAQICTADGGKIRRVDGAKIRRPYKDEEIHRKRFIEETSSSIEAEVSGSDRGATTTSPPSLTHEPESANPAAPWVPSADEVAEAREMLRAFRGFSTLPDLAITRAIVAKFDSLADLTACLSDLAMRKAGCQIRSYGYFTTISDEWRNHRRDEAARDARTATVQIGQSTSRTGSDGRTEPEPHQEPERPSPPPTPIRAEHRPCPRCGDTGTVEVSHADAPDSHRDHAWCDCATAQHKRRDRPDWVDRWNRSAATWRARDSAPRAKRATPITTTTAPPTKVITQADIDAILRARGVA